MKKRTPRATSAAIAANGLSPSLRAVNTISVVLDTSVTPPVPRVQIVYDVGSASTPQGVRAGDHAFLAAFASIFTRAYTIQTVGASGLTFKEVPVGATVGTVVQVPTARVIFEEALVTIVTPGTLDAPTGSQVQIAGSALDANNNSYNGTWTVRQGGIGLFSFLVQIPGSYSFLTSGGGTITALTPTGTGALPPGPVGPPVSGVETATINGGIVGLLSPVPQLGQFTNRMIMALGNGWAPFYVPDGTGTPTNPAFQSTLATITSGIAGGTDCSGVVFTGIPAIPAGFPGAMVHITTSGLNAHGLTGGSLFTITEADGTVIVGQVIFVPMVVNATPPPKCVPDPHSFEAFLYVAAGTPLPAAGSIILQTASPLPNTYQVQFPVWVPNISVNKGDVYVPSVPGSPPVPGSPAGTFTGQPTQTGGGVYVQCTQAGITGPHEPAWPNPDAINPALVGQGLFPIKNIIETISPPSVPPASVVPAVTAPLNGAIWEEVGYLNSLNPEVPGAAHLAVYSSVLFLFNTYPFNTTSPAQAPLPPSTAAPSPGVTPPAGSTNVGSSGPTVGIDGPTSLRQSDVNNPFSWNPANQTFIDKDDGSEGMGLGTYTIAAVGIPPQGALFAFKNYATYEINGLFGAGIQISRVRTEKGCVAPRTIKFVPPAAGVARLTHLGLAIVDGVNDAIISDPIRPYLLAVNDLIMSDIQFVDPGWAPFSYSALVANPPMFLTLVPVGHNGTSQGALTRGLAWDPAGNGWYIIDYPFSLSVASQILLTTQAPPTLLSGWQDGLVQRWQYGDQMWEVGSSAPFPVAWSYRTPVTASQNPDQRVFCQEISVKGVDSHKLGPIFIAPRVDGTKYPPRRAAIVQHRNGGGDFIAVAPIQITGLRFRADVSGTGGVEIGADDFHIVPKPLAGRLVVA